MQTFTKRHHQSRPLSNMRHLTIWLCLALCSIPIVSCSPPTAFFRPSNVREQTKTSAFKQGAFNPTFYSFLRGEGSTKEKIQDRLQNYPIFLKQDPELYVVLHDYLLWGQYELFSALSVKVSFENNFDKFLKLLPVAANDHDQRYFHTLIEDHAFAIRLHFDSFWNYMIETYGCCSSVCLTAAACLQNKLPDAENVKEDCSVYLLSGLFKRDEPAGSVKRLLSDPCIEPNCSLRTRLDEQTRLPFCYALLNCNPPQPSHYYSCFFNEPRVDVNCVIPCLALLGHDPEESNEIQVCALPLLYHSLIFVNFEAFFQLIASRRLNWSQILRYLPYFVYWMLSQMMLSRRKMRKN